MVDPKLITILKLGSEAWNSWREGQSDDVQIDLSCINLATADLSYVNLSGIDLPKANLFRADLSFANLRESHLSNSNLSCTDLRYADLSDAGLLRANLSDVNLSKANLNRVYLWNANLSGADLSEANLHSANLSDANLRGASLNSADLSETVLSATNLSGVDLNGADLRRADLRGARLIGTRLHKANLRGAKISGTIFASVDLRQVKGLTEIEHLGPSHIGLNTILLPSGSSALHFLRGCGVPDEWIDDYRARMRYPIQYHSCFISYSGEDGTLARRLHADLQAQGVRCWFAPEDMKIGDKIRPRIDEAIHLQEKFLLLLSEHSIYSMWVEDEVEAALEKERRYDREVLFPIRLDDMVMHTNQSWAAKLRRTRHIGDFANWTDPQAYQQSFDRLLRDLKAETKGGSDG